MSLRLGCVDGELGEVVTVLVPNGLQTLVECYRLLSGCFQHFLVGLATKFLQVRVSGAGNGVGRRIYEWLVKLLVWVHFKVVMYLVP